MPKITVEEYGNAMLFEDDIGGSKHVAAVFSVTVAQRIKLGAQNTQKTALERGITTAYEAHPYASFRLGHDVSHAGMIPISAIPANDILMITNGPFFRQTLDALALEGDERTDAERNATNITRAVINAYGRTPAGDLDAGRIPNALITGLVYGRIQSGKTRAMIASTAMAFDNGFRISVVMTSNINDLVNQTHGDFSVGLPGLMMFTKDNDLEREVPNTRVHLEQGRGHLLLVCSKGRTSLHNIADFLHAVGAEQYPTLVFDDEGDQASLDTNTRRRARSRVAVAPSKINEAIQARLRMAVPRHAYVSVTGTPQAVLLQSADSSHRPSFIVMLPPGNSYTGGDRFFSADEPEDSAGLIRLVDAGEQRQLLDRSQPMPAGLRESLLFFLVSSASAIINLELPEKGYSYLCHPSLRNDEQEIAEERINQFLTDVYAALLAAGSDIERELRAAHDNLQETLGAATPPFDDVKQKLFSTCRPANFW